MGLWPRIIDAADKPIEWRDGNYRARAVTRTKEPDTELPAAREQWVSINDINLGSQKVNEKSCYKWEGQFFLLKNFYKCNVIFQHKASVIHLLIILAPSKNCFGALADFNAVISPLISCPLSSQPS